VIEVTVLSENPIPSGIDLATVAREIVEGDWSGAVYRKSQTVLGGRQMAKALENQGSDSTFFGLTQKGEDVER
jgi:hypothetical protein